MSLFNPFIPFNAFNLSKIIRRNNNMFSNPCLNNTFSYNNNNFDSDEYGKEDEYEDEDEEDLFSYNLTNRNNFLRNYRDQREDEMKSQKEFVNNLYSTRNKLEKFDNMRKKTQKKFSNLIDKYENEEKVEILKNVSEIKNILENNKNEEIKKKQYLDYLDKKIENKKKEKQKKMEQRQINKRLIQKEMLNAKYNEEKIKLEQYKKEKKLKKDKEEKEFLLEKNQFKINTDLKLNELKNKAEIVPKLQYFFEKSQKPKKKFNINLQRGRNDPYQACLPSPPPPC